MFFIEHNLPIAPVDHLIKLFKTFDTKSKILQKMSCARTKTTAIINNVIGLDSKEAVVEAMSTNKFSLLIDESTDCSTTKHLVMVARLLIKEEVYDVFAGLLEVNDCTAEGIYQLLVNFFAENNIDYKKNMVGFVSDGASVMMGSKNSVMTRLRADIPSLFVQPCICHSLALAASYACEKLPLEVENMMKDVFLYFRYSSKRQHSYKKLQEALEISQKKLLNTCKTR